MAERGLMDMAVVSTLSTGLQPLPKGTNLNYKIQLPF